MHCRQPTRYLDVPNSQSRVHVEMKTVKQRSRKAKRKCDHRQEGSWWISSKDGGILSTRESKNRSSFVLLPFTHEDDDWMESLFGRRREEARLREAIAPGRGKGAWIMGWKCMKSTQRALDHLVFRISLTYRSLSCYTLHSKSVSALYCAHLFARLRTSSLASLPSSTWDIHWSSEWLNECHLLVRSLICFHRWLICLLRTARFVHALRCAHFDFYLQPCNDKYFFFVLIHESWIDSYQTNFNLNHSCPIEYIKCQSKVISWHG